MTFDQNKALANVNQAIKLNPQNHDYYNFRGDLWKKLGNPTKAQEDYEKAISLEGQN